MMNKAGKKDTRNSKTPPDKRKTKTFEQPSSPVQEEPEPVSCVLQGDEIQALAIKLEELKKLHAEHPPEEEEKPSIAKKFLVRKSKPQATGKKTHFLVAYPAVTDETQKTLHYSGIEGPIVDNCGHILSHSILGTLQEFKKEALARGHSQVAAMIPDSPQSTSTVPVWWRHRAKQEEKEKNTSASSSQHMALQNWHRNMALRKKQQKRLCEKLPKSESELLMNFSDNYRKIQEERTLIDRCLPALYPGKGYTGNEFWNQPVHIGDELTGLIVTLGQSERGLLEPVTHVGKPRSIWMEMGTRPPKSLPFHRSWDKSLFLKHRRKELKEILEKMDFYCLDLDGLEVVGRNQPFVSVSAQSFASCDDIEESDEQRKIQDPLEAYPDVFLEPVLGPSLMFCGQPARWINDASHEGEIGIAARVTFEILVGEKAESWLIVSNDGTAATWYDWRRQSQPLTFQEKKGTRMQYFYFNTRSGVILPGETRKFSFIFKSLNAGIFSETWEFGTHPVLLGGAVLQVTLWGIAVYEDKTSALRENLQQEIRAREIAVIVEENLHELLDRIRTPPLTPSPMDTYASEEELFHAMNPELHYQHQVVKGLHELWDKLMNPPRATYEGGLQPKSIGNVDELPRPKSALELQQKSPVEDTSKSISPDVSGARKSVVEELMSHLSVTDEEEDVNRVEWNLSIADFRQILLAVPVEEEREAALAHLNKAALELCNVQISPQTDLMYQICFQLWREVIDGLVNCSLTLRSLLGMPEKDTYSELVPEEPAEIKPVLAKGGKEDRRLQKEDKKSAGKEEKKAGKAGKEERPNSKKLKSKEERKLKTSTKESKDQVPFSLDSVDSEAIHPRQELVDPVVQGKYHEKLYVEVYGLLDSMLSRMLFLFEELKQDALEKKKKAVFGSDFIMK